VTTSARVLLVRHGQSTWNAEGRWQGWADPPLTELGEQQARDAVEHLRDAGITHVVASDLQRARRTGELIAEGLGIGASSVEVDPDLRERDVGAFSGRTTEENHAAHPEAFDGTRILYAPGGETAEQVLARVIPALLRIAHRHPGDTVLVATHSGVIRNLERHLGSPPVGNMPNLGGRWLDVCEGGRMDLGDPLLPIEPELTTRPDAE
jgi:broad specificity phosphatase PhoE